MTNVREVARELVAWRDRVNELDDGGEPLRTGEGTLVRVRDDLGLERGELVNLAYHLAAEFSNYGVPAQLIMQDDVKRLLLSGSGEQLAVMRELAGEVAMDSDDLLPPLQIIPIYGEILAQIPSDLVGLDVGSLVEVARGRDWLVAPLFVLDDEAFSLARRFGRTDRKQVVTIDRERLGDWGLVES